MNVRKFHTVSRVLILLASLELSSPAVSLAAEGNPEIPGGPDAMVFRLFFEPIFGGTPSITEGEKPRSSSLQDPREQKKPKACPCINPGFTDLGKKGAKGKISGPNKLADGTYSVVENSCYEVSMQQSTGYVNAVISFKSTKVEPCVVSASFKGSKRESGSLPWVKNDITEPIELKYDAASDEGTYKGSNGSVEDFWSGNNGDGKMTIEVNGGWDLDFTMTSP